MLPKILYRTKRKKKKLRKRSEWNLIGASDSLSLEALGEIGSESEPPFTVLHQPAELPPSLKRLLRRVLGLHIPKVIVQVALHRSQALLLHQNRKLLSIYIYTQTPASPHSTTVKGFDSTESLGECVESIQNMIYETNKRIFKFPSCPLI